MSAEIPVLYLIIMGAIFALMWLEDYIYEDHRHKEAMAKKQEGEEDRISKI